MADHVVVVTWANDQQPAPTVPVGTIVVSIAGGAVGAPAIQPITVGPTDTTATFPAVPEEAATDPMYVISVQMFDTNVPPVAIGPAGVSDPFSVLNPVTSTGTPGKPTVVVQ